MRTSPSALVAPRSACLRGLFALLAAAGLPAWADTVGSERPPVHHAPDIPSQMELGLREPEPADAAGVIPETPLAGVDDSSPFIRDTKLTLHLRNYYLTRDDLADKEIETWAQGGWLRLVSGRAWNTLSFGATVYGSYGLYGPEEKDGAMLLGPGQDDITVLGELYARVNFARHEMKLGRQEYNLPFLNKQDNRMLPNTFEGYSIAAPAAENPDLQYGLGYIDKMKKRNADDFVPMSEAAGVQKGGRSGAYAGGARYKLHERLTVEGFNIATPDLLNIFYAETVARLETDRGLGLKLSGQFIHQETLGDNLLDRADDDTHAFGGMAEASYKKAVATLALTGNSRDEVLISPYGTYAGYNSIIVNDYNRAGEYGLRTGLSYDFSAVGLPGVSAFGNYVWGFNTVDPGTGRDLPNQDELDLTLDYKFTRTWLKGLSIRLRTALIEEEGGRDLEDYRVIVNYTF